MEGRTVEALLTALETGTPWIEAVWQPFIHRDLCKADVHAVVAYGLAATHGNYRQLAVRWHVTPDASHAYTVRYRTWLTALRKYKCALDFRPFRKDTLRHDAGARVEPEFSPPSRHGRGKHADG
jgi:hypothetical protein